MSKATLTSLFTCLLLFCCFSMQAQDLNDVDSEEGSETEILKSVKESKKEKKKEEKTSKKEEVEDTTEEKVEAPKIKFKAYRDKGIALLNAGDYAAAHYYLSTAVNKKPKNKKAIYHLGITEMHLRMYADAAANFDYIRSKKVKKYPLSQYYYATTLKSMGITDRAKGEFAAFSALKLKKDEHIAFRKWARRDIRGCEMVTDLKDSIPTLKTMKLGNLLNSKQSEFGIGFINKDWALFSRSYAQNPPLYGSTNTRLLIAEKNRQGWSYLPQKLTDTKGIGSISKSPENNMVYYTLCDSTEGCKIYSTFYNGEAWSNGIPLGEVVNMEGSNAIDPMIGILPDGNLALFFASDRSNGRGGYDIWYCTADESGEFGKAANAGPEINTAKDEISPYFNRKEGKLYFSSNGHVGLGGMDIYSSQMDESGAWMESIHGGLPLNSSQDDHHYIPPGDYKRGFLSSNRVSDVNEETNFCCEDLYVVRKIHEPSILHVQLKGANGEALEAADVVVEVKDFLSGEYLYSQNADAKGNVIFELEDPKKYKVQSVSDDYVNDNFTINTNSNDVKDRDTIHMDLTLEAMTKDDDIDWTDSLVGTVYFEYDRFHLTSEAPTVLESIVQFLKTHEDFGIEVGGHTDAIGTDEYNLKLSERRAKAVEKYLISKEIDAERLSVRAYGESNPIPLTDKQKEDLSEEEIDRRNRRVEFRVTLDSKTSASGEAESTPSGKPEKVEQPE